MNFLSVFESSLLHTLEWRKTVGGSRLRKVNWGNLRKADTVAYFEALLFGVEIRCDEKDR